MSLVLTNTLTRKKEPFMPLDPEGKQVTWYACGPTVYGPIHIGNARTIVMTDTMRRWMHHIGYTVQFISNITDIDDKIINKAKEEGTDSDTVARKYADLYFAQIGLLGVRKATEHPRATEFIPQQLALIENLLKSGHAYTSEDGSVWFHVKSFGDYGKLSRRNLEEMQQGERVDAAQQRLKRDALDFALWKASKPGEPFWEAPWGKGRPGWHLECSCMAMHCTKSPTIDIHSGGSDLIFPHHENEIAQSEAASGKPFSRYWLHLAMLNLDGIKISKSLGNVRYLDELLERYSPLTLRHMLISAHYRTELNFSEEGLEQAKKASGKYAEAAHRAVEFLGSPAPAEAWSLHPVATALDVQFTEAMNDDFNTAKAFAVLFDCVTRLNSAVVKGEIERSAVEAYASLLARFRGALGLTPELEREETLGGSDELTAPLLQLLIDVRQTARKKKIFEVADEIRNRLSALGIALEDGPEGTTWKRL
jgi:cysteinyl-tRNA synthetase